MRLYGAIHKVEPQSDGTVKVEGIASTEAIDDQGEIVRADAMRNAIPDYMRFPALREMHQLSAAGTTLEADVGDDGATRIFAHVVDPVAVSKVKSRVYRGFSIGGQVTERDTVNRKIITGITLNEISLVDRPANPEAILDCWKAGGNIEGTDDMKPLATLGDTPAGEKLAAVAAMLEPVQVWACGIPDHRHTAKGDAVKCLSMQGVIKAATASTPADLRIEFPGTSADHPENAEHAEGATAQEAPDGTEAAADGETRAAAGPGDAATALEAAREAMERANAVLAGPEEEAAAKAKDDDGDDAGDYGDVEYADSGLQADGKKRYPIDTAEHIRAAWSYINKPENCSKYGSGDCAKVKAKIVAAWKEHVDKDGPPSASEKSSSISEFSEFLNALVDEEVSLSAIITSLHKTITDPEQLEALVSSVFEKGARHGATDQVHLDNAEYCCAKAMGTRSASKTEKMDIADAHKAVLDAGATSISAPASHSAPTNATQDTSKAVLDEGATHIEAPPSSPPPRNATQDTGHNAETEAPQTSAGKVPESPMPKASDQELLDDGINKVRSSIATLSKASEVGEIVDILASAEAMKKAGAPPHHILMDMAHRSLKAFSSGSTCKADAPDPERHSDMDMTRVHKAHYHIGQVGGGKCAAANEIPGGWVRPDSDGDYDGDRASRSSKAIAGDDLAKALTEKTAENALLTKTLAEIVPLMTAMHKRIEQIAETPIPPRAIARTAGASMTKAADNSMADQGELSPAQVTEALARMSKEEQTLTMIKASQRTPIVVRSIATPAQHRENFPAR